MTLKIIVTSVNPQKITAVERALDDLNLDYDLASYSCKTDIAQPLNKGGLMMNQQRIAYLKTHYSEEIKSANLIISLENFILSDYRSDWIIIIIVDLIHQKEYRTFLKCADLPTDDLSDQLFQQIREEFVIYQNHDFKTMIGASKTFGELYHQHHPKVPPNDWMSHHYAIPDYRINALEEAVVRSLKKYQSDVKLRVNLRSKFRYVPDYPIKGVNFKVWDDIFLHPQLIKQMIDYIASLYRSQSEYDQQPKIDYIIGLASRGYLLSARLSDAMQIPEVMMKKKGKVAGPKFSQDYSKEYGTDTLELRADLPPGNVLILDDILATGGSLQAAIKLAHQAGHKVIACVVVQDVPALRKIAKEKLSATPIHVILP